MKIVADFILNVSTVRMVSQRQERAFRSSQADCESTERVMSLGSISAAEEGIRTLELDRDAVYCPRLGIH